MPPSQASAVLNGKIYVAGGQDDSSNNLQTVEVFDPATGNWAVVGSLMNPARSHAAAAGLGGALIVAGGSTGDALKTQDLDQVEAFSP